MKKAIKRQKIRITGKVQGVGFRPSVYQAAVELNLTGSVRNDTKGVEIEIQGGESRLKKFRRVLNKKLKNRTIAYIRSYHSEDIPVIRDETDFIIDMSGSEGAISSEVTPDLALCRNCLNEISDEKDFRFRYPFINCTNCGPRYSIIKNIPYDRKNTTMSGFEMCRKCRKQYETITDRRFHAQPVACSSCGPKIWLADNSGKEITCSTGETIEKTAEILNNGKIAAIKGIGGFHLAVNAFDEDAVKRLRQRKQREGKPFALMAGSVKQIKKHARVSKTAEKILKSPQSPIVILEKNGNSELAPAVTNGINSFAFMLCYAPLHYLLFEKCPDVLVMTSANISEQPLICDNDQALEKLGDIADIFLMHNRDIYRQVDDSIVHIVDNKAVLLRRGRGYTPEPVEISTSSQKNILAAGADMKNSFCIAKGSELVASEHIGDLSNSQNYKHYTESVEHLSKLFGFEPEAIACDLHPGYLSVRFAKQFKDTEIIKIQHHWAHIASVLAEHNYTQEVIGIECDGTGYGLDGAVWGCECMRASLTDYERLGHLEYFPLAGADSAAEYAIRPVIGLLKKTYRDDFEPEDFKWLTGKIESDFEKVKIITRQIEKNINCVQTSSLGRVFDAAAAMAGVGCKNTFDAELPMKFESLVNKNISESYDYEIIEQNGGLIIRISKMLEQLIEDVKNNTDIGIISSRFHNCLAEGLVEMAVKAREKTNLNTAALSGGVFCNHYLLSKVVKLLKQNGFSVLFNSKFPSNDGGIAAGQAGIAAKISEIKRSKSCPFNHLHG